VLPGDIHGVRHFSSYSDTWVGHAKDFVTRAIGRFALGTHSFVVEAGSNDGYLLQHFVAAGIPVLGIDPAANIASAARQRKVPTEVAFFGEELAQRLAAEGRSADLIVANNVLAQVPDLHDFVVGLHRLLKPRGVITIEFPHLLRLMQENQFDTIYHEHFSYFSFLAAQRILTHHGLRCFDVDELPTHGGSLRLYVCQADDESKPTHDNVSRLTASERTVGLDRLETYAEFAGRVQEAKRAILLFLIDAKRRGSRVAGYGAPGKGNTLLNYCGIGTDFIDYTVDAIPISKVSFSGIADPSIIRQDPDEARLPLHPSLEPKGRDYRADARHSRLGRAVRGSDPKDSCRPMIFSATSITGAVVVELETLEDERGFFARSFCAEELTAHGLNPRVVQCSVSFNRKRGTLRGLHFQRSPHAEVKLVRCTSGMLYDVIVDLRPDSPTFRQHVTVELSARNHRMLYVPEGCAHGF
jgi:dTDP-4-dehydrorhamnose 3,5-epimerase-like enzyme/SAM-dependent methyltransferase